MNINHLKLELYDTYEKDEEITTDFEPADGSDVINKAYLDESLNKNERTFFFKRKRL